MRVLVRAYAKVCFQKPIGLLKRVLNEVPLGFKANLASPDVHTLRNSGRVQSLPQ